MKPAKIYLNAPLLAAGSVCMALLAGCRPQFLAGAFFALPIFWDVLTNKRADISKQRVSVIAAFCIPFIVIGAALMGYNYTRFGSPFDFGAGYNLTTNDMTSRGFVLARIPVALWMYFFQPANINIKFPFVFPTEFQTSYMIKSIIEETWGGLFNNIFLFASVWSFKVRDKLREKGLYVLVLMSIILAFLICIFDAQFGGIYPRYFYDCAWFLFVPALIVYLQRREQAADTGHKRLDIFVLGSFCAGVLWNLLPTIKIWGDHWVTSEPNIYFRIANALQFWL